MNTSFTVLQHCEHGAIVLVSTNNAAYSEFIESGYNKIFEGGKQQCIDWLNEYWETNYVVDEERLYLSFN